MIEVTTKSTKLKGTKEQIKAEFCCLVHHLVTKDEGADVPLLTKEELDECIDMAMLSDEELNKRAADALTQLLDALDILRPFN